MAVDVAAVIAAARSKLGAKYVWGAEGPSTFDCSGLMVWSYAKEGVTLPRTSQEQAKFGKAVPLSKVQPGDLITSNWGSGPSSHVGMYIGGGKLIHAPRPGSVVKIASLDANYRSHVNQVRRVPGATSSGVDQAIDGGDLLEGFGDVFGGGWIDKLFGGGGAAGDALGKVFSGLAGSLGDIATGMLSVGKVAEFLLRLALPSTWVRVACGLLGSMLLFLGVWFLARESMGAGA